MSTKSCFSKCSGGNEQASPSTLKALKCKQLVFLWLLKTLFLQDFISPPSILGSAQPDPVNSSFKSLHTQLEVGWAHGQLYTMLWINMTLPKPGRLLGYDGVKLGAASKPCDQGGHWWWAQEGGAAVSCRYLYEEEQNSSNQSDCSWVWL